MSWAAAAASAVVLASQRQAARQQDASPASGPVCVKCGHGAMRSWGGWGHAPGYSGSRHVVVVETQEGAR